MIGRALLDGVRELRTGTLKDPPEWLRDALGAGGRTNSGVLVDEQTALCDTGTAACVRVVSETVADLPCLVYERVDARTRRRADDDVYAPALRLSPNPEMTGMEYWENMTAYPMLWGHGEAYINRRRNGTVELWPLPPNRVERVRQPLPDSAAGKVTPGPTIGINVLLDSGEKRFVRWRDVVSVRAFGYAWKSPIQRHRESIGLGLAAEEFGARFFGQGGAVGGFIKLPPVPGDNGEIADRIEARHRAKHEGLERSHLVGILEGGAEWQSVGMPLRDAQYIEGRKFSVEEKARIFRVQLHKVQHLEKATFSNIEEQNIEWVVDTIGPWLTRHEQAHRSKLFDTSRYGQPGDRWPEFLVEKLLRGNHEARYKAYALAIQFGWLNRNEVRELENRPPFEGGDDHLTPLNLGVVGEDVDPEDESIRKLAALIARRAPELGAGKNGSQSDHEPDYLPAG